MAYSPSSAGVTQYRKLTVNVSFRRLKKDSSVYWRGWWRQGWTNFFSCVADPAGQENFMRIGYTTRRYSLELRLTEKELRLTEKGIK